MTPFAHGGDVTAFAKDCNCDVNEVIDLSSNINFVKPTIDIDFNTLDIAPYPNYEVLYDTIASHYTVQTDKIELFNGGSSAIFSLFRWLSLSKSNTQCTIYSPAYLEYKKAAKHFGYELHIIDRLKHFGEEVKENSFIIFVNPSTPDGMFYNIEYLLQTWQAKNCTVLVDESFIEFTSHTSVTTLLDQYPNLYILKSMTKFFGAAGIRVGTLISQAKNIKALKDKEPLWKLSAFDSAYIQAVLKDKSFKEHSDATHKKSKNYLLEILQKSPHIKTIYPSEANYILVELANMTAKALQIKLLPYKIMIRSCENFDGLSIYHVRIAIKSIEDLTLLKRALYA
jgi:threonine-phosphate decarboxylase